MLLHANKSALVAAICGLAAIPNLAAAAVTMQQAATDWKKPAFCKTLDCPHFEVQSAAKEYEVRQYESAVWGSTHLEGLSRKQAAGTGFMRLFRYIQGENVERTKIAMTAPVTTLVLPGEGPLCANTFTVSFYAPDKYQDGTGPPEPTNKDVFLETRAGFRAAVISYPGFSSDQMETEKAAELKSFLDRDAIKHRTDRYWVAGYDSPCVYSAEAGLFWGLSLKMFQKATFLYVDKKPWITFVNRHNEVWIELV